MGRRRLHGCSDAPHAELAALNYDVAVEEGWPYYKNGDGRTWRECKACHQLFIGTRVSEDTCADCSPGG